MYCICGAAVIVCCKMKFGLDNTFEKSTTFILKKRICFFIVSLFREQVVRNDYYFGYFSSKVTTVCRQNLGSDNS